MKKLLFAIASLGVVGLFQYGVQAQTAEPTIIEWTDVEMSFGSVQVGTNTISRQGDSITFDAVIEYYARYNGNRRTQMIYALQIGSLDENYQPDPMYLQRIDLGWSQASGAQARVLEEACALSV